MVNHKLALLQLACLNNKDKRWFKKKLGKTAYAEIEKVLSTLSMTVKHPLSQSLINELSQLQVNSPKGEDILTDHSEEAQTDLHKACEWLLSTTIAPDDLPVLTADTKKLLLSLFDGNISNTQLPSFAQIMAQQLSQDIAITDIIKEDCYE